MLTFKRTAPGRLDPLPTFEVLAGAARLGFITDTGPDGAGMRWKGTAADGTRLAATSKAKLAQKLQIHDAATRNAPGPLGPIYAEPARVSDAHGRFFSHIHAGTSREDRGNLVATVTMGGPGGTLNTGSAVDAAARLLAAAPKLLAALKSVQGCPQAAPWLAAAGIHEEIQAAIAAAGPAPRT